VVDEDAGELVADGLVDEQGRDGRVDTARERAEHALVSDLSADPSRFLLDHRRGRPERRRIGDVVQKPFQDLHPVRGVEHLRMELDAVDPVGVVLERGDRRRWGRGDDTRALGRRDDRVAMAHPDDLLPWQVGEEAAPLVRDLERGPSELRRVGAIDPAAEVSSHELHPVADAEHRHVGVEERTIDSRRIRRVHGCRPAREDDRSGVATRHLGHPDRGRHELRVDAAFAYPTGDQLSVLAAEIDHEDRAFLRRGLRRRKRENLRRLSRAGNSATP
jgi:hypothetical protein